MGPKALLVLSSSIPSQNACHIGELIPLLLTCTATSVVGSSRFCYFPPSPPFLLILFLSHQGCALVVGGAATASGILALPGGPGAVVAAYMTTHDSNTASRHKASQFGSLAPIPGRRARTEEMRQLLHMLYGTGTVHSSSNGRPACKGNSAAAYVRLCELSA